LALVATAGQAAAQDATPTTAGHPLVGTWVIDNDTSTDTGAPPVAVFTSDGTFTDAAAGFSGVWAATGPTTATHNFLGIIDNQDGFSGYVIVGGPIEVDATGDAWTQTYTVTTVAADGTVVATSPPGTARAMRLQVIPPDGFGKALAEVPVWTPAAPPDATPAP
jgi:hypothetical protein